MDYINTSEIVKEDIVKRALLIGGSICDHPAFCQQVNNKQIIKECRRI